MGSWMWGRFVSSQINSLTTERGNCKVSRGTRHPMGWGIVFDLLIFLADVSERTAAMKKTDYWATPPKPREQMVLFEDTLDSVVGGDDPVRLLLELLGMLDWSEWEQKYNGRIGKPPIHPKVLAGLLLHGLMEGIRSSRQLEKACRYRVDFMWLAEGFQPSHDTFCVFRRSFEEPLKALFIQVGLLAKSLNLVDLETVGYDATRAKANNSRYNTGTLKKFNAELKDVTSQLDDLMAEMEQQDADDHQRPKDDDDDLSAKRKELEDRKNRLESLRDEAESRDKARKKQRMGPGQVPRNDLDSRVMENKEGGFAPNYTPTATTDGLFRIIVHADVLNEVNETPGAIDGVEAIKEAFGEYPENFLTDAGNNSAALLGALESKEITVFAPVESSEPQPDSPVLREDLSQPLTREQAEELPRNNYGQFSPQCFVLNPDTNCLHCPAGKALPFEKKKSATVTVHRCHDWETCPFADLCVNKQSKAGRTVSRSIHHDARERTHQRMKTDEGRSLYDKRPLIAETAFAIIKNVIGLRQFLLTGLPKVRIEWRWATIAYNLKIILREWNDMRAHGTEMAAA